MLALFKPLIFEKEETMTKRAIILFSLLFIFFLTPLIVFGEETGKDLKSENGFIKGSEAYLSFSKRLSEDKRFIDDFINKEIDANMKFSLWRNDRQNTVMTFGAQTLIAPNETPKFIVSFIGFELSLSHYFNLDSEGRWKARAFLVHRSQHIVDLPKLGVKIPTNINDDFKKNVFPDLNILGGGVERRHLPKDNIKYYFRVYFQPSNTAFPNLFNSDFYKRPVFLDGELYIPFSGKILKEKISFYGASELGALSVGMIEFRIRPIPNIALFLRQSFFPEDIEAINTSQKGIVYRGLKFGFFIEAGNLF